MKKLTSKELAEVYTCAELQKALDYQRLKVGNLSETTLVAPPSLDLECLDLCTQTFNILSRVGVKSLDDLAKLSENDLLSLRGFGRKALAQVKDRLDYNSRQLHAPWPINLVELHEFCLGYFPLDVRIAVERQEWDSLVDVPPEYREYWDYLGYSDFLLPYPIVYKKVVPLLRKSGSKNPEALLESNGFPAP